MAPQVGLEPTTLRLTAGCSAIELLRSAESSPDSATWIARGEQFVKLRACGRHDAGTVPATPVRPTCNCRKPVALVLNGSRESGGRQEIDSGLSIRLTQTTSANPRKLQIKGLGPGQAVSSCGHSSASWAVDHFPLNSFYHRPRKFPGGDRADQSGRHTCTGSASVVSHLWNS